MPKERIRQLLEELHRELEERKPLDSGARRELRSVMGQIGEALEQSEASEGADEGLGERLEEAANRFAGEHPRVVAALRELVDGLNRLGI